VGAPTTPDYIPWFLSITRRWMTPRGVTEAAQYTPAAPAMTHFVSILLHLTDYVADYILQYYINYY
jgi:hypothetical protein